MRKFAAIPFLFFYSCVFVEVPNDVIVEPFLPIEDVLGEYTIKTTLLDISEIPFEENITSISDGILTLNFDQPLTKSQANVWGIGQWGLFPEIEGPNPHLLFADYGKTAISISLSMPVRTFGFELLPDIYGEYQLKVSFFSENKLIGSINKSTGGVFNSPEAMLFAASTNASFDGILIEGSSNEGSSDEGGIAMAQFRYVLK